MIHLRAMPADGAHVGDAEPRALRCDAPYCRELIAVPRASKAGWISEIGTICGGDPRVVDLCPRHAETVAWHDHA